MRKKKNQKRGRGREQEEMRGGKRSVWEGVMGGEKNKE